MTRQAVLSEGVECGQHSPTNSSNCLAKQQADRKLTLLRWSIFILKSRSIRLESALFD
ncbi:hypothetical protein DOTSEDRAFT_73224 [Dothistroma septosporum NZE10]|uniref:Uncharacterized protein n=1 Tax=Dothistroma septosporum (strain NZE10 / CBS 128990) TaxID=675120 RepID=N1PLY3_DOTSN|nr:hypothetical protein DOTSEDRAFT_73224 [Dothistroma septosporum NZE10]